MIILIRPELIHAVEDGKLSQFFAEARVPQNTRIFVVPDLPEEDDESHPILAFKVSAGETHYWRGDAIVLPEYAKKS
jgi:hypothetical protein